MPYATQSQPKAPNRGFATATAAAGSAVVTLRSSSICGSASARISADAAATPSHATREPPSDAKSGTSVPARAIPRPTPEKTIAIAPGRPTRIERSKNRLTVITNAIPLATPVTNLAGIHHACGNAIAAVVATTTIDAMQSAR